MRKQKTKLIVGVNDLAAVRPDLAKEWHPTKNGELRPEDVTEKSGKKVWWHLPYDDHNTGRHYDFEWEARVFSRAKGAQCPYLTGRSAIKGVNDLATINEKLAQEWHPTKNGKLKPDEISAHSGKKVWWIHPYDDPRTGKHFEFEWEATITNRMREDGCPFLSGKAVWPGFNDLATVRPDIAKQWHPTKNGTLSSEQVTENSNQKVWWQCSRGHEWRTGIHHRAEGSSCPYCAGQKAISGETDLGKKEPELCKQWNYEKNGSLTPSDVMPKSDKKVWWRCEKGHEWKSSISNRVKGCGCPVCSGSKVVPGVNDLATARPDLAAQWHPVKNGSLKSSDITPSCNKKVWWQLPYDDSETGKHFDFEWEATPNNRVRQLGCPFLSGQRVWPGFNDLATTHPQLSAQWHPTKNGKLTPEEITAGSPRSVWWLCRYDDLESGKHWDFEWKARVNSRITGQGCPYLTGHKVQKGFNDLASTHPSVAKEWHSTKNKNLTPQDVTAGSGRIVWWLLPYDDPETGKHLDFEWRSRISHRAAGNGCPYLSESSGEQHVRKYLEQHSIVFTPQKTFADLIGVGDKVLRYDFAISERNILIEYNGMQHYKAIDYFGGEGVLKVQKDHDHRKREYARKHGYHLIEIHYKYATYEDVSAYLDKHLLPLLDKNEQRVD